MENNAEILDFVCSKEYGKDVIARVQRVSISLTKKIIDIFEKHGIEYIVAHGTLLGLVRHNGHFIPWDDDCDLFVFDWCYARAIELLRRELPEDMVIHNRRTDPIYWCKWTKIRDTHSDTYESLWVNDRKLKYHGICIDLLRVTPCTQGEYALSCFQKQKRKRQDAFVKELQNAKQFRKLKKMRHKAGNIWYALLQLKHLIFLKLDRRNILVANKDTIIEGAFKYKDVFPLQLYDFEGLRVLGPKNPDGVLKSLYGDYMKIPPFEKRLPHFSRVEFLD